MRVFFTECSVCERVVYSHSLKTKCDGVGEAISLTIYLCRLRCDFRVFLFGPWRAIRNHPSAILRAFDSRISMYTQNAAIFIWYHQCADSSCAASIKYKRLSPSLWLRLLSYRLQSLTLDLLANSGFGGIRFTCSVLLLIHRLPPPNRASFERCGFDFRCADSASASHFF